MGQNEILTLVSVVLYFGSVVCAVIYGVGAREVERTRSESSADAARFMFILSMILFAAAAGIQVHVVFS